MGWDEGGWERGEMRDGVGCVGWERGVGSMGWDGDVTG